MKELTEGVEKTKEMIDGETWEDIRQELSVLSAMESLSTKEDNLRSYLVGRATEMGIETKVDEKGNLWFLSDQSEGEIMLCAHMDKIGNGVEITVTGDQVSGRLDDALGMSVILSIFKEGLRPSALFTVQEESDREVFKDDGSKVIVERELDNGIYNAGARYAAEEIFSGKEPNPKLALVADVSRLGKGGGGPLVYTSSMHFHFPNAPLVSIKKILSREGLSARYLDGPANDSIDLTFKPLKGVVTMEIHVDNLHSDKEKANLEDIVALRNAIKAVVKNHQDISEAKELPVHAREKAGPFSLPESMEGAKKEKFNGTVEPARDSDVSQIEKVLGMWIVHPATRAPNENEIGEILGRLIEGITNGRNNFFVARGSDGNVVGVLEIEEVSSDLIEFSLTGNALEVQNIYVDNALRGSGIGKLLILKAEEEAGRLGKKEVLLKSGPLFKNTSWKFYEANGFEKPGMIKDFSGKGEDAQVFRKLLD